MLPSRIHQIARLILLAIIVPASPLAQPSQDFSTKETVGRIGPDRIYTPANQILTPAGLQVELPGMRPQVLALSPNGKLLVTAGKTHEIVILDPITGEIRQRVP